MKIAIASNKKEVDSQVSETGGRAAFFLIFEDGQLKKTIKNPFRVGGGGVGFSVAAMLADEKVEMIVSGHFGDNMASALEEKGIQYKVITDLTIEQVLAEQNK